MSEAICCYVHLTAKVFVPPSFQIRGIAWRVRFSSTRPTTSSSIWRASTISSDPVDTGLTWVSRGGAVHVISQAAYLCSNVTLLLRIFTENGLRTGVP